MENSTPQKAWKRRKFIIFPSFQYVLLGANLGVAITISIVVWVLMRKTFSDLGAVGGLSGFEVQYYKKYLDYQVHEFQFALFWALAICIVVSGLVTVVVSHRFAGPLIRMRHFFRRVSEAPHPLPKLEFREGDYLMDFPPLINGALETLQDSASAEEFVAKSG